MKKYTIQIQKDYMQFEKITILAKNKETAIKIAKNLVQSSNNYDKIK